MSENDIPRQSERIDRRSEWRMNQTDRRESSFSVLRFENGGSIVGSAIWKGFYPHFVWKDDKIGGEVKKLSYGEMRPDESWTQLFLDLIYVAMFQVGSFFYIYFRFVNKSTILKRKTEHDPFDHLL